MSYSLELGEGELARYRMMAQRARQTEAALWERAGIVVGARIADVGCGPGATLAVLAETVGPTGWVSGVDANEGAIAAARRAVADATNVDLQVGRADDTGLLAAGFDVVVMRHVLAHNGGNEQAIVDHLATLARPGGCVYLVDVDLTMVRLNPLPPELGDMNERYVEFHRRRGNDPSVGLRLDALLRAARLEVVDYSGALSIMALPAGIRPPSFAAAPSMIAEGVVTELDVARWTAAYEATDQLTDRPTAFLPTFVAIGRRPG